MRVHPDDVIAGVRTRDLRDYFRRLRGRSFIAEDLVDELGVNEDAAFKITELLVAEELIIPEAHPAPDDDRMWFELSTRGNALALASFAKRFSREKAEQLLREVVSRAVDINANDELTHRVTELRVFGSFVSGAEDLGDLDLAYALEFRHPGRSIVDMSMERARLSGRSGLSHLQLVTFGSAEVLRLLRGRSPRISLHRMEELEQLGVEGLSVFPKETRDG